MIPTQAAEKAIALHFPNAIQDDQFLDWLVKEISNYGFRNDNCLALTSTCRDEVCQPLVSRISKLFGSAFNISGLGGLINCGKTGMKAGLSHSPQFKGLDGNSRRRYIFFAFPHIAIGRSGELGKIYRRGISDPSDACGAMFAIKHDPHCHAPDPEDFEDAEFILLKRRVVSKMDQSQSMTLVSITDAASEAITEDLISLIEKTVDVHNDDYVVITGIQIHAGAQESNFNHAMDSTVGFISPKSVFVVSNGIKTHLQPLVLTHHNHGHDQNHLQEIINHVPHKIVQHLPKHTHVDDPLIQTNKHWFKSIFL